MHAWIIYPAVPFAAGVVAGYFLPIEYLFACSIALTLGIIVLFKQETTSRGLLFFIMTCGLLWGLWSGALIELLANWR